MSSFDDICDVLIVGAGPAGLSAALAAAASGVRIVVIDDNPFVGGQIWRDGKGAHLPAHAVVLRRQVAACKNVTVMSGTRVVSVIDVACDANKQGHTLLLENPDKGWLQQCHELIICTGGRELFLPFPGWTLPGVTGAGGLQALIKSGMSVAKQRIVIAGTGPLLLATAKTAKEAGADVIYIAEQTSRQHFIQFGVALHRWPKKLLQAFSLITSRLHLNSYIRQVKKQGQALQVQIQQNGKIVTVECDRVACGFGLIPNTQLAQLCGCAVNDIDGITVTDNMHTSVPHIYAAGECTGFGGSDKALLQGTMAGLNAVGNLQKAQQYQPQLKHWLVFEKALAQHFVLREEVMHLAQYDTVVCRCEDVSYGQLTKRSGWIDAKLHTRCGMGPCQGRVCGAAAQKILHWQAVPQRDLLAPARLETLIQSDR